MKKILVLLLLGLAFASSLYASVAKIVAASGEVSVLRDKKEQKASVGFELEEKDTVFSKGASKAQIIFNDKTVITIGKESEFKIEEYLFEAKNEPKASFGFTKGAFRAITGQIGKVAPDKFELKTKTATIGIRGTQILLQTGDESKIACTDGAILVTSLDTGAAVEVKAGEITTVEPNKPPKPPRIYKPDEIKAIAEESGGGGEKMEADEIISEQEPEEEKKEEAKEEKEEDKKEKEDKPSTQNKEEQIEEAKAEDSSQENQNQEMAMNGTDDGVGKMSDSSFDELESGLEMGANPENIGTIDVKEIFSAPTLDSENINKGMESAANTAEKAKEELKKIEVVENDSSLQDKIDKLSKNPQTDLGLPDFTKNLNDSVVIFPEDDPYVSWGAWYDSAASVHTALNTTGVWVAGDITPSGIIDGYIKSSKESSYGGLVEGIVKDGSSAYFMENGSVNLDIKYGSSNPVIGNIEFSANSENWKLGVGAGSVNQNGFAGSLSTASGSSVTIGSGSMSGRFYGEEAQSLGGTFKAGTGSSVENSSKAAYGVFTGAKK